MIQVTNVNLEGSPIILNLAAVVGFFTLVAIAADEPELPVRELDIFHSIFGWSTFDQGVFISAALWFFRVIERAMGTKLLSLFLGYNMLMFIPFFVLVLFLKGFSYHFSFFSFVPYGLFIYMLWHIPALRIGKTRITDKLIMLLIFVIIIILQFPFGFLPLVSAIIANVIWTFDTVKLQFLASPEPLTSPEDDIHLFDNEDNNDTMEEDHDGIKQIEDMGFTRSQAVTALRNNGNDVQKAVDYLLSSV